MAASVEAYLRLAAQYETVITNRLHFAIAGLLQSRRVILLPNAYHKNRSVWDSSLRLFGCHFAETVDEAISWC